MKKIMLVIMLFGYSYTLYCDDLFHTGSCNVPRVNCANSFALAPAPNLVSSIIPTGNVAMSGCKTGRCPLLAQRVNYAPLSINVPQLQAMVQQIRMIPNYQNYPHLAEALYDINCTIAKAQAQGGY